MKYGNVIVTGGAGFLGSRLVRRLLPLSKRITVIDNLSTGRRDALPKADTIRFVQGSITDETLLAAYLPGTDTIFHLACANLVQSAEDMDRDFQTNLQGGYLLMKLATEHCPQLSRFIYTSTASVYGNADMIPTPESHYRISLPYSASKFAVEHYGQVFHEMKQLPVAIARFSNVYGPGQVTSNPYCGVVSKYFEAIARQEPLTVYGDGQQTRDFTYVEDALDALLSIADSPDAIGNVYNIGTGVETSVLELAEKVARAAGRDQYPVVHKPLRKVDKVIRRAVSVVRIQQLMGWQPKHSLDEGLRLTHAWLFRGEELD
jgi:UDP-glucose 4-epimerase